MAGGHVGKDYCVLQFKPGPEIMESLFRGTWEQANEYAAQWDYESREDYEDWEETYNPGGGLGYQSEIDVVECTPGRCEDCKLKQVKKEGGQ